MPITSLLITARNVAPTAAAMPTADWIRSRLFAALPRTSFPVLGGGPRITRVLRPQGTVAEMVNPVANYHGWLGYVFPMAALGASTAATLIGRAAGQYVTTWAAVVQTDKNRDAALAELRASFAREFPTSAGWTGLQVIDYSPDRNGPLEFWSSGNAQQTNTRDRVQGIAEFVAGADESPVGPTPPDSGPVAAAHVQQRFNVIRAAVGGAVQGAGDAAGNVLNEAGRGLRNGLEEANRLQRETANTFLWTIAKFALGGAVVVGAGVLIASKVTGKSAGDVLRGGLSLSPAGRGAAALRGNPAKPAPPDSLIAHAIGTTGARLDRAVAERKINATSARRVRGSLMTAHELLDMGQPDAAWATMGAASRTLTAAKR